MEIVEVHFSKNDDKYQIKTERELEPFKRVHLKQYGFTSLGNNTWEIESFDELKMVNAIREIFKHKKFQIIPDAQIKEIIDREKKIHEDYENSKKLGLEIKKQNSPDLPKTTFRPGLDLLPFQKMPVKHMISVPNCANFSIPGTGKTVMTLAAFDILKNQNKVDQMWVIGPVPSFKAWEDEYENLFGKSLKHNVVRYHGNQNERDKIRSKLKEYDVVITSFDTSVNDLELIKRNWIKEKRKIFLVLDESHHIKAIDELSQSGNPSRATSMIELGKYAKRKCILTGTPIPRDLEDLWSQVTFLWPEIKPLGERHEYAALIKDFDAEDEIKDIIDFVWTRVSNKQLSDEMPERFTPPPISVPMDQKQQEIYRIIESQLLNEIPESLDKEKIKQWKKAMIIRLLQAVTNPKLIIQNDDDFKIPELRFQIKSDRDKTIRKLILEYEENEVSPKLKAVAKKANEIIADGKSVIIFSVFKGNVHQLQKLLKHEQPLVVTGDFPTEIREKTYESFKNWDFSNGKGRILLATLGSVAESVSLHKNKQGKPVCQNVIYLERNFNGGQFMQSLYRVYRVGSDKKLPITYYFFESKLIDGGTTLDKIVSDVLDTRLKRMYDMLEDEFSLSPIELEEDSEEYEDRYGELYGAKDTENEIMAKIEDMIKSRKQEN